MKMGADIVNAESSGKPCTDEQQDLIHRRGQPSLTVRALTDPAQHDQNTLKFHVEQHACGMRRFRGIADASADA